MFLRLAHDLTLRLLSLLLIGLLLGVPAPSLSQAKPERNSDLSRTHDASLAGAAADLSKKNVLILHMYSYDTSSYTVMDPVPQTNPSWNLLPGR